jgi:molybdenum-dependent DNA-binding transcriptional regulator ModE
VIWAGHKGLENLSGEPVVDEKAGEREGGEGERLKRGYDAQQKKKLPALVAYTAASINFT